MRPNDRSYLDSHEWAQLQGSVATVGITDFAVEQLGELVYLDLPAPGRKLKRGESFGEVESVKAVSDINSPVEGEVVEVNSSLTDELASLQNDPFKGGWLIKVKVAGAGALQGLMDAAAYEKVVASEA
jgi:glycine cleavage system H protein